MKVHEVIEGVLASTELSDTEKKEIAELISEALRQRFHIVSYAEQTIFE
jgi:hypothetical protein